METTTVSMNALGLNDFFFMLQQENEIENISIRGYETQWSKTFSRTVKKIYARLWITNKYITLRSRSKKKT